MNYNASNTCISRMAYTQTYLFPSPELQSANGSEFLGDIFFSEIFDGTPQFYPGSTVTVQEILQIFTRTIPGKEHLLDVDKRWFQDKTYFGTYQVSSDNLAELQPENEGAQGFITQPLLKLIRYSNYTVVANPDAPIAAGDIFTVDNCNFGLQGIELSIGGATISAQKPLTDLAMFSGNISRQRAPLADTKYNMFFRAVGLYHNPGCYPYSITRRIQVINAISTDYENFPNFACVPLGG